MEKVDLRLFQRKGCFPDISSSFLIQAFPESDLSDI